MCNPALLIDTPGLFIERSAYGLLVGLLSVVGVVPMVGEGSMVGEAPMIGVTPTVSVMPTVGLLVLLALGDDPGLLTC